MYRGITYMFLSATCFSIINMMVKMLSQPNAQLTEWLNIGVLQQYPVYQIVFFRSIISLTICAGIIKYRGIPFWGNNIPWLIIRGIFGATALTLFFYTLRNLPIAIATTVQYLSPLFTVIFAIFLVKEKIRVIQWLFILLALAGVFILGYAKSNDVEVSWFWLGCGIVSAICSGIAYNAIMKCRNTDQPITVVMYFPLIATPIMAFLCWYNGYIIPIGIEWILLLLIGLFTQTAQVCMTRAFHSDTAANVTPIKYVGAIYAALMGLFIFGEQINDIAYFGISLIIISVLLNTILKAQKS